MALKHIDRRDFILTKFKLKFKHLDINDFNKIMERIYDNFMEISGSSGSSIDRLQAVYVGKHGDDSNSGLTPDTAKLTIGAAITIASGLTPSISNQIVIEILDGGTYVEDVVLADFIHLNASMASMTTSAVGITTSGTNVIILRSMSVTAGDIGIRKTGASGNLDATVRDMVVFTGSEGFVNDSSSTGFFNIDAESILVKSSATAVQLNSGVRNYVKIGQIRLDQNNAKGIEINNSTINLSGTVGKIIELSGTGTIGLDINSGIANLNIQELLADTAYDISATGTLNMFVNSISGIETNAGIANITIAGSSDVDRLQTVYVGKHGDDANSGLTPNKAKLTIVSAVTVAEALVPSLTNQIQVEITDAGEYDENIALTTGNVHIYGPTATLKASSPTLNYSIFIQGPGIAGSKINITLKSLIVTSATGRGISIGSASLFDVDISIADVTLSNTNTIGIFQNSPTGLCYIKIDKINIQGTNNQGVRFSAGTDNFIDVGTILHTGDATIGFFMNDLVTKVHGTIGNILEDTATNTTALLIETGIADISVNKIGVIDTAYNISLGATLNMFVNSISGAEVNAGTANVTVAGVSGGGGTVTTDNTLWVAESGGTAHGSRTAEISDPYDTIAGALGDALSGDTVTVLPGTYAESGLTVPAGVSFKSQGGYEVTSITGAAATGTRVVLKNGSLIDGFTVTIPTDALYGVQFAGTAGQVASVRFLKFEGQTSALGSGFANTGAGKTIAFEVRYGALDCENILLVTAGILAVQAFHVPGTGTVQRGAKVSGGRLQALDMNIGNANVLYGVEIGTGGIAVLISLNLFNLKNGLLITGNDVQVDALSGKIETTSTMGGSYGGGLSSFTGQSLVVDSSLSLSAATIRINVQMEPNFIFNNTLAPNAAGSNFSATLVQETTGERDASQRLLGTDSQIGFPEQGRRLMTGEGGANATFNHVVQMDSSDVATDITDLAKSTLVATFTFGSVAVNEKIAWCSTRRDGTTADLLKTFGLILDQQTAGTDSGTAPTYVFEIFDGSWTEIGIEAISVTEQYRYANDVFLRAGSNEQIRLGATPSTAWTTTTIDSVTGYWARVRISAIAGALTLPTFNQLKTTPNHVMWNEQGKQTLHGLAQYRKTLFGAGNMWGEGNGTGDTDLNGGTDGFSSLKFTLKNKKSRINGTGDYMTFQFAIPGGLCTAYPISFKILHSTDASSGLTDATFTLRLVPLKVEGILVADGSNIVPAGRAIADTDDYGTVVPLEVIHTNSPVTSNKLRSLIFSPYDISDYYEDDILVLQLEVINGAGAALSNANMVDVFVLIVEGVAFTDGKIL